jgi:hypothetical protein
MLDRLPLSKSERLSVGSLCGVDVNRTSFKEEALSSGSCSASETSSVAERGKVQDFNCVMPCTPIRTFPSNLCLVAEKL